MNYDLLLSKLPFGESFLFVDEISNMDENGVTGSYTFRENLFFYKGHFKDSPITPGVILTECCAQIGLVCLGMHLLQNEGYNSFEKLKIGLSSSEMEFYVPVSPGTKVIVSSKKVYYRFNKLKCEVKMRDEQGNLVCKGLLAGMLKIGTDG